MYSDSLTSIQEAITRMATLPVRMTAATAAMARLMSLLSDEALSERLLANDGVLVRLNDSAARIADAVPVMERLDATVVEVAPVLQRPEPLLAINRTGEGCPHLEGHRRAPLDAIAEQRVSTLRVRAISARARLNDRSFYEKLSDVLSQVMVGQIRQLFGAAAGSESTVTMTALTLVSGILDLFTQWRRFHIDVARTQLVDFMVALIVTTTDVAGALDRRLPPPT